jgi:hypothetical protein
VLEVTRTALIANVAFAVAILVSYTLLTALGHDSTALLTVLIGQGASLGIASGAKAAAPAGDH